MNPQALSTIHLELDLNAKTSIVGVLCCKVMRDGASRSWNIIKGKGKGGSQREHTVSRGSEVSDGFNGVERVRPVFENAFVGSQIAITHLQSAVANEIIVIIAPCSDHHFGIHYYFVVVAPIHVLVQHCETQIMDAFGYAFLTNFKATFSIRVAIRINQAISTMCGSARMMMRAVVMMVGLTLVVGIGRSNSEGGGDEAPKVTVRMTNDIGRDLVLTIHCRHEDEDLGEQVVQPRTNYEFSFIPNFWGTNLYTCQFSWEGGVSHFFDIFKMDRDYGHCTTCVWSIREYKPCRLNDQTHAFDDCFDW
ncbi:Self-incompatibility protein [Senna tora]|uniref:Self-incompatibility protein n=1 Tax=Senna tora TaxID=362788 RepID=A0A834X3E5_9FABA|nr:Self-incompatibility protein [Senna tora]